VDVRTVRRGDVLSAWSGIRPLVVNPASKDTQSLARNHVIEVSDNNLVTIAGICRKPTAPATVTGFQQQQCLKALV